MIAAAQQAQHLSGYKTAGLVLTGIILYGGYRFVKAFFKTLEKEFMFLLVWRFLTGAHLHGERRTDAGWWSHGSETKRHSFERGTFIDQWEHKPRGHRALWRLGILTAIAGLLYGLVSAREITIHALEALGVYGVLVAGFVIEMKIRRRVHARAIEKPCAKSIARYLRMSPHAVRKMIHIDPENITDEGEIGWFGPMPDHLTPGEEQQTGIARIFDVHLPVDSEMVWKMDQQPRIAVLQASQKPPDRVTWKEAVAEMAKCKVGEVLVGKDKAREWYRASLTDLDDPHWGFDVNTKFGKSNFLGITLAQILHQNPNSKLFILDPKRSSLIDFVGSPDDPGKPLLKGVYMANNPRDPERMWAVIRKARAVFEHRAEEHAKDRTRKFPPALILLDELGQFGDIMRDWWNDQKAADKRLPKEERQGMEGQWPGWDDIIAILRMGRFVNMHVIACAQDFRDDAFGGRGGRNLLGLKGMAGFNSSQWDKFMQSKPTPVMQNHPGRWIFSDGNPSNDTWVQVVFANAENDRSAYEYAAEGRENFIDVDVTLSDAEQAALATDNERSALTDYLSSLGRQSVGQQEEVTDSRQIIPGEQAAADYFGWKLTKFQSARRRQAIPGEFRRGRTPCWYEEDLIAWEASRPRNKPDLRLVRND